MSRLSNGPMMSWTSPPEQKLPPFEPNIMALISRARDKLAEGLPEFSVTIEGDRVLALGALERDHGNAVLRHAS